MEFSDKFKKKKPVVNDQPNVTYEKSNDNENETEDDDKQYYGWKMKTSHFNPHDIVLKAIDNYVPDVADGTNMYVILEPPKDIVGCRSMQVTADKNHGNLHIELDMGKILAKDNVTVEYALKTMKDFVAKDKLPNMDDYYEMESTSSTDGYKALAQLLLCDEKASNKLNACFDDYKKYYNDNQAQYEDRGIESDEDKETVLWFALVDCMLENDLAVEVDWKEEPSVVASLLNNIILDELLKIDTEWFINDDLAECFKTINSKWKKHNYVLSTIDIDSDSYVLTVMKVKQFKKAKKLASDIGKIIDVSF